MTTTLTEKAVKLVHNISQTSRCWKKEPNIKNNATQKIRGRWNSCVKRISPATVHFLQHPATHGADFEPVFAGANFSTEKVSGALSKSQELLEKTAGNPKSLRSSLQPLIEISGPLMKSLTTLKVSGPLFWSFNNALNSQDLCASHSLNEKKNNITIKERLWQEITGWVFFLFLWMDLDYSQPG